MKTSPWRHVAIALLVAALVLSVSAAESLSVLLQKGIYAEETEGNLDSAIKIYEQIAAEGAANRALISQAQYRLAVCYQKQGKKEQAVATLNDIVRRLPSEAGLGQKARAILTELGQAPADAVALRKLPLADASWIMAVSPDGRFIAYVGTDWTSAFIYETASARTWAVGKSSVENPWGVVFSPDSTQIAYDTSGKSIWVAKIDGSDSKELYRADAKKGTIWPVAWSSASGQVLARSRDSAQNISALVSLDLKSSETKEILPSSGNTDWSLSSDGRYLAQRIGRKAAVFDLVSRKEEPLLDDHVLSLIGWSHHDSEFLFTSNRTGAKSLWTIAVKSGRPIGEPRFLKEYPEGTTVASVTRDGGIYYTEERNSGNVFLVSANFETGELVGEPRLVTDRFPNVQTSPVWSRDGQKLWLDIKGGPRHFVAVSVETGQQQDYSLATAIDRVRRYSLSKDGSSLLVAARKLSGSGGPTGIHRFEPASGKIETVVVQRSQEWIAHPRLSPDDQSLYYVRRKYVQAVAGNRDSTDFIVRRDLRSNHEQIVHEAVDKINMWAAFELSPDGSRMAIVTSHGKNEESVTALSVLTIVGGEKKELLRLAPRENVTSLGWTPDGKRLVYTKEAPSKNRKEAAETAIWSTAVDSGESVKMKFSRTGLSDIAIHPGGREIAFQTGSIGDSVDVWVMEGLIPKQLPQKEGMRPKVIAQSSPARGKTPILVADISGPNNSIHDRQFGLSATLPTGWTIKNAGHTDKWGNNIEFTAPGTPDERWAFVNYKATKPDDLTAFYDIWQSEGAPRPTTSDELDSWMRSRAEAVPGMVALNPNYKIRPASFVSRIIGGHKAWSWSVDYTKNSEEWIYYWTVIETGESGARFQLTAPTTKFAALRPAFDAMIESVRFDPVRLIPLDEITGPNNSILDRKVGLALTYPAGWTIARAVQRSTGTNTISLKIPGASHVSINYRSTTPWEAPFLTVYPLKDLGSKPTNPAEIDAWLRRYAQAMEEQRIQRNVANYRIRAGSMVSRPVNGYATLSWVGDFTEGEENRTEYFTLIYSGNAIAQFFVGDSVASIEPFRPAIEEMLQTIRLP